MPIPSDRDLAIADRFAAGERVVDLAAEFGLTRGVVYDALRKANRYRTSLDTLSREPSNLDALVAAGRLPVQLQWGLKANNITTLDSLAQMTRRELMAMPMVGPKTVAKIEALLAEAGRQLQPDPPHRR